MILGPTVAESGKATTEHAGLGPRLPALHHSHSNSPPARRILVMTNCGPGRRDADRSVTSNNSELEAAARS